ncbi:MAG: class I SAM-dependent RNA methyltransferase [Bdellovibrionaceae bacterium]|nr:class I SAM-dependent RNA methyltransferase [Pseudobdellovibrionaceae bacterium]
MYKVGDIFEVTIDKMANRGKGLGRINEQVVFVPYSAPQDVLKVQATKISKNFIDAEIIEILRPSSMRTQAPCPYFTDCGGCHFQHIHYPQQVQLKDQLVKETLLRALGNPENVNLLDPIASPSEWHYRNRIQVHVQNDQIGFHKRNSHSIIPIKQCLIAEPALNSALPSLKITAGIEKIELLLDKNMQFHTRDLNSKGQPTLFSQVNRFANDVLVKLVVDKAVSYTSYSKLFDLYSGDGNFLIALTKALPNIDCRGVELNPGLVKLGREEIRKSKLNARYTISSVENYLETVSIDSHDMIVLDPPRTGCDAKAMMILGSSPRNNVIYVSCEPTTLARDLRLLKETAQKWGLVFRLRSVQTLDMFPQTEHIETVVEFSIDKIDSSSTTH